MRVFAVLSGRLGDESGRCLQTCSLAGFWQAKFQLCGADITRSDERPHVGWWWQPVAGNASGRRQSGGGGRLSVCLGERCETEQRGL